MDLGFPIRHLQERLNEFRLDLHRLRLYRSKSWNYDVEHRIQEYGQAIDILNKANGVEQSDSNCNLAFVSNNEVALIDFLIHLNDKGLINNHDFDYEKEAKKYIKKIINAC
ncbi:hypothetical protein [uncultured Draconibacterium sp.]|uniref:hypothetical protein n=1 Tax=uncultured Draconibacterium sp. TaxID=1573823 RepID=UPI0032166B61